MGALGLDKGYARLIRTWPYIRQPMTIMGGSFGWPKPKLNSRTVDTKKICMTLNIHP